MKKILFTTMLAVCTLSMQAQFSGQGSGTEKDPYQITNADELFEVRNDLAAFYKVMNDIDLTDWIREESPTQGWTPIGNETTPFKGNFDGGNYTVKGLMIDRPSMDNIGFFGYTTKCTICNVVIENATILGKSNVGVLVGYADTDGKTVIDNCHIIAPKLSGDNYIGGLLGKGYLCHSGSITVRNNSCMGGKIEGNDCAGGLIGYFGTSGWDYYSYSNYIEKNYVSCSVSSKKNTGGLAGIFSAYKNRDILVYDNISESICIGNDISGGVWGRFSTGGTSNASHNIFSGKIKASQDVSGIGYFTATPTTYTQNFCIADTLYSSSSSVTRIGINAGTNNYAYNGTVVYQNGKLSSVEDNDAQGTGYGLRTLKKESTYVGAGFDFTNTWTIKEGETFPYLKTQVAPVTITSFEAGNKATIKGTATEGTTVYVVIGDNMYETFILDGQWEVSLGRINVGTEAKVYAMSRGKMPSISTKALAESGASPIPDGKTGDANGDGVVDSADVTAIINYILGKPSTSFNKENADVTGDGEILIDDAVQTVQLIMNAQ